MRYRITHSTEFIYEARTGLCYNEARLLPRELPQQKVLSSRFVIDPLPFDLYDRKDYFGNRTTYFSVQQPHDQLIVVAESEVETTKNMLAEEKVDYSWEVARETLHRESSLSNLEAAQFILDSPLILINKSLRDYASPSFVPGRNLIDTVNDLMQRIYHEFKYDPEFSTIATPLKDVLDHRRGVCQDFAHLAIGCIRAMGLAARYVSGYIETEPPPGKERLIGADASHAWFAVYLPGVGWIDFDPTNNQLPGDRHVTVAWGRDFSDVTPLKGVAFGSGEHELKVAVDVLAID